MATRDDVRAFLDRPWDLLRAAKDRHVAMVIERDGANAAFDIAEQLARHAAAMGARPSSADRDEDLACAIRLKRLLDRADSRRSRRSR